MIELIPAIDIIDGQCVRLTKGDYDQKTVYRDSPAEVAKEFEQAACRRPGRCQVETYRQQSGTESHHDGHPTDG